MQIHIDAFGEKAGARVLLMDDLIATGGTAKASVELINQTNATCVEACFSHRSSRSKKVAKS